jgi:uncharacterized membrane protein
VGAVTVLVLCLAVFLACAVEAVEALTIVLAVGTVREWRSTSQGVVAGLLVLAVIVAALGPALTLLPISVLRLVVGGLLLIFGLQWLRKAVLRASGYKDLHDESLAYQREVAAATSASRTSRWAVNDWYSFVVAFKAVLLEGLEVAFIVLTFAAGRAGLGWVVLAALAAILVVVAAGVAARRPLARVPENTLKFAVGALLTTFGTFWAGEGAGNEWPGGEAFLLAILALVVVAALVAVRLLRQVRERAAQVSA